MDLLDKAFWVLAVVALVGIGLIPVALCMGAP